MRITTFRKVGLGSCVLLALLSGAPSLTTPAFAASGTGTTNPLSGLTGSANPSTLATQAVGLAKANPNLIGPISQVLGQSSGISPNVISSMLTSFTGTGGIGSTASAQTNLLSSVLSGQTSGALGTALAGVPGLGTQGGVTSALASAAVKAALGNTPTANLISQAISGAAGGPQSLAQMAQTPSVASAIQAAATQAFGPVLGGVIGQVLQALGLGQAGQAPAATGASVPTSLTQQTPCGGCCSTCATEIPKHYLDVRMHVSLEFQKHRQWFLTTYWKGHILPALMLMADQLTTAGILQVEMFGTLLDAKHQLETQRLFQELMAKAHKDYQPSEGMCTFGTTVRSLAASERKSNVTQLAFAQRMSQRQTMSGDVVSKESQDSDIRSRLNKFISTYCDQADNANGLGTLCPAAVPTVARRNIDIDYTRNIESRLTLDMDIAPVQQAGGAAGGNGQAQQTPDAEDIFALSANLFSHNIAPKLEPELFATPDERVRVSSAERYLDLRAIFAKRSVAQNSFAAITAMRAAGEASSAPYTKRLIYELGVTDTEEIEKILGKNPSYFAQMEILTKKIYQNPVFYTELYDKPVNVERKTAAMQAIGLMQDRDLYNSLLRSEAVLSVLLETMLEKEQEKVANAGRKLNPTGGTQ